MTTISPTVASHWSSLRPILTIRNEREYDRALARLQELLEIVGTHSQHPLYSLLDTLGTLVHAYEEQHQRISEGSGMGALKYLMEEHGLSQSDLPEVGSQGVVSEVLRGKRELNLRQIRALAKRFGVSAAVFIE